MATAVAPPPASLAVGFLAFQDVTQLDMTGPLEVLARAPGARVYVVSAHPDTLMVQRAGWVRSV